MMHKKFINPDSIAVIGASNNIHSLGGSTLKNLIQTQYKGKLYAVNPKEDEVQGIKCYRDIKDLPNTDLAIIAIPAKYCVETIKVLCEKKKTKGFIVFSAGFSEKDEEGAALENEMVEIINKHKGTLLGPNNIGLINQNYAGVFTMPIPSLSKDGVDLISGSGGTALFIIEAAMVQGLRFNSIYTVGNSAQMGVEEVLEYLDNSYDEESSSKIKLLYIESIQNPKKLLKHAKSLINKGCNIAAIKSGSSEAGSRAAASHTGAMASSDLAVDALFEKAGIIRCYGRNDIINIACVLSYTKPKGKNIAIVTHAGGPAVLLTDILSKNGIKIPIIKNDDLLSKLPNGSSVSNPIDFLSTGTAKHLDLILDYCNNELDEVDAIAVIFGSPGLGDIYDVYDVLAKRIKSSTKPIFPIMPSVVNVKIDMADFISKGNMLFTDEVLFGRAFSKVMNSKHYKQDFHKEPKPYNSILSKGIKGFLPPHIINKILNDFDIPLAKEEYIKSKKDITSIASKLKFPLAAKVVGPIHKTDVGGVILNINSVAELKESYQKLQKIEGTEYVLVQEMAKGVELFIGVKKEEPFGHIIMFGIGGVYLEVIKDIQHCLVPAEKAEVLDKIKALKFYPILKGIRGKEGINIDQFADIIVKVSNLVESVPEIKELDLNPLKANKDGIVAVDDRMKV